MFFYALLSTLEPDARDCAEEIFENYQKLIYNNAYRYLQNHQDAEDILDDVMISVIKNIHRFQNVSDGDIKAQLLIYSRNAAINLVRKNQRRNNRETPITFVNEDEEEEERDLADTGKSVEDIVLSRERSETVQKYLQFLSLEHRETIELVYGYGYSNVEAAQALHVTPNAVGMRLFKAKKKLMKLAGGELHECS